MPEIGDVVRPTPCGVKLPSCAAESWRAGWQIPPSVIKSEQSDVARPSGRRQRKEVTRGLVYVDIELANSKNERLKPVAVRPRWTPAR